MRVDIQNARLAENLPPVVELPAERYFYLNGKMKL
jgi:hypothetical protein